MEIVHLCHTALLDLQGDFEKMTCKLVAALREDEVLREGCEEGMKDP